jgi:Family of unknown function (DUF6492)
MSFSYGLITPSYAPDFQRCQLLAWTVHEFVKPPFQHYIVVDRCDYNLFKQLANAHTQIVTVESVLPGWIWREPIFRKVWLSRKTPPIRNWVLQQIVKIAIARQLTEDVAVFIDSDVAFVRPFGLASLAQTDDDPATGDRQVRLFRDAVGNPTQREMHWKWHQSASHLLGLPDVDPGVPDYIGNLITWKRENVIQLCDRLEQVSGRNWVETLGRAWHLSEYVLYGTFVDRVLGERSGQYADSHNFCHDYWFPEQLDEAGLKSWIMGVAVDQVAMMISAKAGIAVDHYEPILKAAYC